MWETLLRHVSSPSEYVLYLFQTVSVLPTTSINEALQARERTRTKPFNMERHGATSAPGPTRRSSRPLRAPDPSLFDRSSGALTAAERQPVGRVRCRAAPLARLDGAKQNESARLPEPPPTAAAFGICVETRTYIWKPIGMRALMLPRLRAS